MTPDQEIRDLRRKIQRLDERTRASRSPENILARLLVDAQGRVMTQYNPATGQDELLLDLPGSL